MSRSALRLAALASAAVPGLDPVTVQGAPVAAGDLYEFAFVTDNQGRQWVVKAARTPAAAALLEDVTTLTSLLARRLDVALPVARAVAAIPGGRAIVRPRLPGRPVEFAGLAAGPGLAVEIGRTLARIHNVDPAVFDEAGRPSYDAETHRKRTLSELDRASGSGHVPAGLLARWEHQLEDVSRWRFAPTPVHGRFVGSAVLASTADEASSPGSRVLAVLGWEEARIGDPADDFADLLAQASEEAVDTLLEAYVQARVERPDASLLSRARLAAEMSPVVRLLRALSAGAEAHVERISGELAALDERLRAEQDREAEVRRTESDRQAGRDRRRLARRTAVTPERDAEDTQPLIRRARITASEAALPDATPREATPPDATPLDATQPVAAPAGYRSGRVPAFSDAGDELGQCGSEAVEDHREGASEFVRLDRRPRAPGPGTGGTQG